MSEALSVKAPYESLSAEYYDQCAHPTCANFTESSHVIFARFWAHVFSYINQLGHPIDFADIGCGRSVLAEELIGRGVRWRSLKLIDQAPGMLAHSKEFVEFDAQLVLGDAEELLLETESIDVATAFMGDPFNTIAAWRELSRVVRPGGLVIFTAPSSSWANSFRSAEAGEKEHQALFVTHSSRVYVPSFVLNKSSQQSLVESAGFNVLGVTSVAVSQLRGAKSPKLISGKGDVAEGYLLKRIGIAEETVAS